jgi:hypothetical protein
MILAECPNCCSHIEIKDVPLIGHPVICFYCNVQLEITWLFPVTLDYPERQQLLHQDIDIHEEL